MQRVDRRPFFIMFTNSYLLVFMAFIISISVRCDVGEKLKFPDDFMIGVASSAYQVEGAWNASDKGVSSWDHFVHQYPDRIIDRSNGDVACDSFRRYKEDMKLLRYLGVDHYRFSISWPRVLPKGHDGYVSKTGLNYYHKILDELDREGIVPFVTIYHWDHPQLLENFGGWLNERMAYMYANYARVIFSEFGHRVKFFITINEPISLCWLGYGDGLFAPGRKGIGRGEYLCLQNVLKANALAYHVYDNEFRKKYGGKIGTAVQCTMSYNRDNSSIDVADEAFEFFCGSQLHPIFSKTGDFPNIMKQRVAERSRLQGYNKSRLPIFSNYWIEFIKDSADFLGLNYYTPTLVVPLSKSSILKWPRDEALYRTFDPRWPPSHSFWLRIYPRGLRDLLVLIKNKYGDVPVYIMENGVSDNNEVNDLVRIDYLRTHMEAVLMAIKINKCNVKAYTVWSLTDNFEWTLGYKDRFGLFRIDFNDANRTRSIKKSASWFRKVLRSRNIKQRK